MRYPFQAYKWHWPILITLISVLSAQGQLIPARPVTVLDYESGLLNAINYFMYKDSRGLVWISSDAGLYRYDGKALTVLTPGHDSLTSLLSPIHSFICEDKQDNLWFGTWLGISCYVRNHGIFRNYSLPDAQPHYRFFVAGIDSTQQVWFTHGEGIYTLNIENGKMRYRAPFDSALWNSELQLDENGQVRYIFSYNRYDRFPGLYIHLFQDTIFYRSYAINSEFDTIDNLILRLHQYAFDFFKDTDTEVKMHLPPVPLTLPIPGAHRREIYLAFKEALHNVLKHAMATRVNIHIEHDAASVLSISIKDNGQGFDPATVQSGHGLESMRRRMEESGGELQVCSGPEGSMISLVYPVPA